MKNISRDESRIREISSPNKYPPPFLEWKSKNPTYNYYWWPMLERSNIENRYFNLYSKNGGLDKYDLLFDTDSVQYQKTYHRIQTNSNRKDKNWAGFCNLSAILACSYPYPENNVVVVHKKKQVVFTPIDIEGLMIIAAQNSIKKGVTINCGYRNNEKPTDDPNEPYPSYFLSMLEIMCKQDEPFIMDIDNGEAVWNYAYDKVFVTKHKYCHINHILPTDKGLVTYYNFKIESTAYPDKNLDLWGYIINMLVPIAGGFHMKIKEGWITQNNPDFIWKTIPKKCVWEGSCDINPHINAEIVFMIYKNSFTKNRLIIN